MQDKVKDIIIESSENAGYEIEINDGTIIVDDYDTNNGAMETDKGHIHFLISYDTTDRVCDIVKLIKQQTTHYLWQKYPNFLSKCYWKHKIFWSDGYFACSIGEVSSATIQKYIESQG